MAAPTLGISPEVLTYFAELEQRLAALETPQGFQHAFVTASTSLTAASAAANTQTFAILSDLKTFAWSDGVHWYRADTGAAIV